MCRLLHGIIHHMPAVSVAVPREHDESLGCLVYTRMTIAWHCVVWLEFA